MVACAVLYLQPWLVVVRVLRSTRTAVLVFVCVVVTIVRSSGSGSCEHLCDIDGMKYMYAAFSTSKS